MILNCKEISKQIKNNIKVFIKENNIKATLAIVSISPDNASEIYLKNKVKACEYCGIKTVFFRYDNITESEIIEKIKKLNENTDITGILIQLPLPNYFNEEKILNTINPKKDVDCLTNFNLGKFFYQRQVNDDILMPCTANGCLKIIKSIYDDISGKKAVVIGRSNIVGKPVAQLLLQENCTVSILHSKSKNIIEETKKADIIVVAVGKKGFLKQDMIKEDSLVIDVGINRIDGKIFGDVDFDNIKDYCKFITPVPNGVGQLTVACLMENVIKCL